MSLHWLMFVSSLLLQATSAFWDNSDGFSLDLIWLNNEFASFSNVKTYYYEPSEEELYYKIQMSISSKDSNGTILFYFMDNMKIQKQRYVIF